MGLLKACLRAAACLRVACLRVAHRQARRQAQHRQAKPSTAIAVFLSFVMHNFCLLLRKVIDSVQIFQNRKHKEMRKNILVLGAGRVGGAIALDLAGTHNVTIADISEKALQKVLLLNPNSGRLLFDGGNLERLKSTSESFDLIVNALPGFIGFSALKNCIECGKDVVDISFFPENPFDLHALAQEKGVKAVVDCGIAPGLSNMIAGYHFATMDVRDFVCYVGGLPEKTDGTDDYKAPFSPDDVIEEYMRDARFIRGGMIVRKPALSDVELVDFDTLGALEAFNTDGLRTLLQTLHIPNMVEKPLRHPGHADRMQFLRDFGFFDDKFNTERSVIFPKSHTAELLKRKWRPTLHEKEFTVMRVEVVGTENRKKTRYTYTIYDAGDEKTNTSSMARTTGYTATAVARLLLNGWIKNNGIIAPECLPMEKNGKFIFQTILDDLRRAGISIQIKKTTID